MAVVAVLLGIGLGLSLAAPPGPMNALIAREASRHGAAAGVRVGMGAPVADVVFLAALVLGLSGILDHPSWVRVAAAFGSALMGYFAWTTLFAAAADGPRGDPRAARVEAGPGARPASFWAGFFAALTNPYQIAWWLSGGFVFLQAQGGWGIAGLLAGIFGWVLAFAWLVAHGAQRWAWFQGAVRWLSAALLGVFSVLLVLVALSVVRV